MAIIDTVEDLFIVKVWNYAKKEGFKGSRLVVTHTIYHAAT